MIDANRLMYLGTSRGLPVYASTDDVMDIREEWTDAREAAASGDIDDILEENRELARELEEVQYLYVPLRPTGCVFQTVRVVEQVRKK
jgi:chromosome segregation ATPase